MSIASDVALMCRVFFVFSEKASINLLLMMLFVLPLRFQVKRSLFNNTQVKLASNHHLFIRSNCNF